MKVFVTGASGFVGGAVVRQLLSSPASDGCPSDDQGTGPSADEHEVFAMARSESSADRVRRLGAIAIRCSLEDVAPEHLRGMDAVVHCAAYVEEWGSRDDFWNANVVGTERMLAAAREAGVGRFLFIGTEAALFRGQDMRDIDESYPYPDHHRFLYSQTKAEAEKRVLAAHVDGELETMSIRPRLVWGPGDTTVLPTLAAKIKAGQFAWIDGGRMRTSTTHVDNLAHAVELALTRGRGGQVYFITDDEVHEFKAFASRMLATQGVDAGERSLPGWAARAIAAVTETVWRTLHLSTTPPLTRLTANLMSRDCTIRIDKARRELGYTPRTSVEAGLRALAKQC